MSQVQKIVQEIKATPLQQLDHEGHFSKQQINEQLIVIENELQIDLRTADIRMQNLQNYISNLSSQTSQLQTMASNEKDPQKRGNLYKIINQTLELCATFEGLYLKAMEVKHRFRQEFNASVHKKVKLLEIELELNDSVGELNKVELLRIVDTLNKNFIKFSESQNPDSNVQLSEGEHEMKTNMDRVSTAPEYDLR